MAERPTLRERNPTCSGCFKEVEHDGDNFVCQRCRVYWSNGQDGEVAQWLYPDEPCGDQVSGTVPSWAGEDQIDPCRCALSKEHEGNCKCSHELAKIAASADSSTPKEDR